MFDRELLRSLRKEQGLSQGEVGQAVGLTPSAIGNYERGVHEPSRPVARKLAAFFGVDAAAFWTDLARPEPDAGAACRPATAGDLLRAIRTLADAGAEVAFRKEDGPGTLTVTCTPTGEPLEQAVGQLAVLLTLYRPYRSDPGEAAAALRSSIDAWMEKNLPELDKLPLPGAEPPAGEE